MLEFIAVLGVGLGFVGLANWWLIRQDLKYYHKLVHGESSDDSND